LRLIDNDTVASVLAMPACVAAQARAFAGLLTGASVGRPRVGHWGLPFAACGAVVYREAKARGLGRELPTEWFLQDIRN
jgi:hypothetical protein